MVRVTKYHQYALMLINNQNVNRLNFDEMVFYLWDALPRRVSYQRMKEIVTESFEISHGYYDDRGKNFYPSCEIPALDLEK